MPSDVSSGAKGVLPHDLLRSSSDQLALVERFSLGGSGVARHPDCTADTTDVFRPTGRGRRHVQLHLKHAARPTSVLQSEPSVKIDPLRAESFDLTVFLDLPRQATK